MAFLHNTVPQVLSARLEVLECISNYPFNGLLRAEGRSGRPRISAGDKRTRPVSLKVQETACGLQKGPCFSFSAGCLCFSSRRRQEQEEGFRSKAGRREVVGRLIREGVIKRGKQTGYKSSLIYYQIEYRTLLLSVIRDFVISPTPSLLPLSRSCLCLPFPYAMASEETTIST